MCNIVNEPKAAENINEYIITNLSQSLFLFYKYNPDSVRFISADARFMAGINNLYKLTHDTGCIVTRMWYVLTGNQGRKKINIKYRDVYDRFNLIDDIRSIINHNNNPDSFYNSQQQLKYRQWCAGIIGKAIPSEISDYEKMNIALKKIGEEITNSCYNFIDEIRESADKQQIIDRWISELYKWYGKKREIFYAELEMKLKTIVDAKDRARLAKKTVGQIIGILNEWIEDSFYYEYESKIEHFKVEQEELFKIVKVPAVKEKVRDVVSAKIKACEDEIDRMEKLIMGEFGVRNDSRLERIDFVNFFFSELTDNLKKIEQENKGINLSPEILMQEFISQRFKNIPVIN